MVSILLMMCVLIDCLVVGGEKDAKASLQGIEELLGLKGSHPCMIAAELSPRSAIMPSLFTYQMSTSICTVRYPLRASKNF